MKIVANEKAENLESNIEFPIEARGKKEVRARGKKRQFDYEEFVDESFTKSEI